MVFWELGMKYENLGGISFQLVELYYQYNGVTEKDVSMGRFVSTNNTEVQCQLKPLIELGHPPAC